MTVLKKINLDAPSAAGGRVTGIVAAWEAPGGSRRSGRQQPRRHGMEDSGGGILVEDGCSVLGARRVGWHKGEQGRVETCR